MAKCAICQAKIQETFLNKPLGTYIYDEKHKKQLICFDCQKKYLTKEEQIKHLAS